MCNLVIVLAFLPEAGREDVCSLMWSTCRPPRAISAEGTQPPPWGPTPDPPGAQGPCSPLGEGPFPSQRLSRARLGPVQSCCLQWLGTCPGGGGPLVQGQHFRMHSQLTGLSELFLPGQGGAGSHPFSPGAPWATSGCQLCDKRGGVGAALPVKLLSPFPEWRGLYPTLCKGPTRGGLEEADGPVCRYLRQPTVAV